MEARRPGHGPKLAARPPPGRPAWQGRLPGGVDFCRPGRPGRQFWARALLLGSWAPYVSICMHMCPYVSTCVPCSVPCPVSCVGILGSCGAVGRELIGTARNPTNIIQFICKTKIHLCDGLLYRANSTKVLLKISSAVVFKHKLNSCQNVLLINAR